MQQCSQCYRSANFLKYTKGSISHLCQLYSAITYAVAVYWLQSHGKVAIFPTNIQPVILERIVQLRVVGFFRGRLQWMPQCDISNVLCSVHEAELSRASFEDGHPRRRLGHSPYHEGNQVSLKHSNSMWSWSDELGVTQNFQLKAPDWLLIIAITAGYGYTGTKPGTIRFTMWYLLMIPSSASTTLMAMPECAGVLMWG